MLFRLGAFLALIAALTLPAAAQRVASVGQLQAEIESVLNDEAFENAFWGVLVVDASSDEVLYARNEKKSFVPASNIKLYTTAAALEILGPHFQYRTEIFVDGPAAGGVLDGNLIVRGSADPTIGSHYNGPAGAWEADIDETEVFRRWADSLRAAGIRRITGDIIGDDDVVDDRLLGRGWSWDNETYYYSAQMSGLTFNDNVVHMHVESRQRGMPATIRWNPLNTSYVTAINRSRTVHADSSVDEEYLRLRGANTVEVATRVPENGKDIEEITVENPTLFFVHVLRESLQRSGIVVEGDPVDVDDLSIKPDYQDPRFRRVAIHESAPLSQIISIINKPSQNLYAELLLKTLGSARPLAHPRIEPGSTAMGVRVAKQMFASAGVDTSRIRLADGSGLSRMNLVTPEMTASLLAYMWRHPDESVRETFLASLPLAGEEGTLRKRLRDDVAHRRIRAKTGTLSHVSSLSGYVLSETGDPLIFVLMCNHFVTPTRAVLRAQDQIANLLARFRP